jgi:hypothetical protein
MTFQDLGRSLALRSTLSTCLIAVAGAAMAQSSLTDADLKTLVVGKTVDFKSLVNGRTGAGYFAPDGQYSLKFDNGKTIEAEWRIAADGTLCILGLAQVCGPVSRGADGVYTRYTGDKPTAVLTKFTAGKTF